MIIRSLVGWMCFGFVYSLARHGCGLSTPQSVFLAALAALPIEATYSRVLAATRFQPFSLWIQPDYPRILMDAGLLADESEWRVLLKMQGDEVAPKDLTDGVTCTLLSYNFDSDTHIIAWPDWKTYTSRMEQSLARIELESLPSAAALPAACRAGYGMLTVRFGIKPGRMGLHIFMCINDQLWKDRWAGSTGAKPPFDESVDSFHRTVDLTVAIIPHAELQCFYAWKPTRGIVFARQRRRALRVLGWKTDYEPMDKAQGWGISHRYAAVTHDPIDQHL